MLFVDYCWFILLLVYLSVVLEIEDKKWLVIFNVMNIKKMKARLHDLLVLIINKYWYNQLSIISFRLFC